MSSIIDCVNGGLTNPEDAFFKYTESETIRHSDSMSSKLSVYWHKYTKYWLQIFLVGVFIVTVVTRSDSVLLTSTQDIITKNIIFNAHSFPDSRFKDGFSFKLFLLTKWKKICTIFLKLGQWAPKVFTLKKTFKRGMQSNT